jgi:hypothetical protein
MTHKSHGLPGQFMSSRMGSENLSSKASRIFSIVMTARSSSLKGSLFWGTSIQTTGLSGDDACNVSFTDDGKGFSPAHNLVARQVRPIGGDMHAASHVSVLNLRPCGHNLADAPGLVPLQPRVGDVEESHHPRCGDRADHQKITKGTDHLRPRPCCCGFFDAAVVSHSFTFSIAACWTERENLPSRFQYCA